MAAKPWRAVTQENITRAFDEKPTSILLLTDGRFHYAGWLIHCGQLSIDLDIRGVPERIMFGNRAFQFTTVDPPPGRVFREQEKDLFTFKTPE